MHFVDDPRTSPNRVRVSPTPSTPDPSTASASTRNNKNRLQCLSNAARSFFPQNKLPSFWKKKRQNCAFLHSKKCSIYKKEHHFEQSGRKKKNRIEGTGIKNENDYRSRLPNDFGLNLLSPGEMSQMEYRLFVVN
ncbi:hypothetical protein CEXT_152401 [Caerostris extrusa]|uniref:Uncharacterized protein n=1 Tax=Caerostris extrusa TaxID=172846 RepID=A0AAV4WS18_CAEEX|nr:hypothetical protein CEXT_152401 [Caerostris extrusa]